MKVYHALVAAFRDTGLERRTWGGALEQEDVPVQVSVRSSSQRWLDRFEICPIPANTPQSRGESIWKGGSHTKGFVG